MMAGSHVCWLRQPGSTLEKHHTVGLGEVAEEAEASPVYMTWERLGGQEAV